LSGSDALVAAAPTETPLAERLRRESLLVPSLVPFIVCNIHDANLFSLQPSHSQRSHSTVIVHLPFSIKWKSDSFTIAPDCRRFPNTTDCLTGDLFQPQFMTTGTRRRAA
jgi:hypothetical protein